QRLGRDGGAGLSTSATIVHIRSVRGGLPDMTHVHGAHRSMTSRLTKVRKSVKFGPIRACTIAVAAHNAHTASPRGGSLGSGRPARSQTDRKSTRLNSSHV